MSDAASPRHADGWMRCREQMPPIDHPLLLSDGLCIVLGQWDGESWRINGTVHEQGFWPYWRFRPPLPPPALMEEPVMPDPLMEDPLFRAGWHVVRHWREFGPDYGFDEVIECYLVPALRQREAEQQAAALPPKED